MSADERRSLVEALRRGQEAAFGPGEYVEQESFVRASEIRLLAERAAIGPDVSVLDLCCGVAGPGRLLTRELGCDYVGVDASEGAIAIAAERSGGLPCRFEVAQVPPLPAGTFEVVLQLETMLAFRDKRSLLEGVGQVLAGGGRFAFTLEEGMPLTESERARMPAADTVWLTPLDEMHALLEQAGFCEQGVHPVERREPDGVGGGHARPLRLRQRHTLFQRECKPPSRGENAADALEQRPLVAEGEHRLELEHHLERARRKRWYLGHLETAVQAP